MMFDGVEPTQRENLHPHLKSCILQNKTKQIFWNYCSHNHILQLKLEKKLEITKYK